MEAVSTPQVPEPQAAAPIPTVEGEPVIPPPSGIDTKAVEAKLDELEAKLAEAERAWEAGELKDLAEYQSLKREVRRESMAAQRELARAEALDSLHQQATQQLHAIQQKTIDRIMAEGKAAGLDYADPAKQAAFNAAINLAAALKPNAHWSEVYASAHKTVMQAAGLTVAQAPAPKAAAPAAAPRPKPAAPPQTLRGLPSAQAANIGNDVEEQLTTATGAKAMAMWSKLTPAQQAKMLGE